MQSFSRPVVVIALLFLAGCSSPDLTREEQAIRDNDARWLKAAQARDAAGEGAMFASDGVAYREHIDPLVGPAAFQVFTTKFATDNPKASTTWSTDAIRIAESGDLAIQTGEYRLTGLGTKGDGEDKGRFVTVWKKVNGEWKVAHDIGSTTSPDAAHAGWETGTWKLNLAQSKFNPGPPPRSETRTWQDRGGGVQTFMAEGVDAQGRRFSYAWTFKYDGTEYPTGLGTGLTAITLKRVDASTVEFTQKVNGKVVGPVTRTRSTDGKSLTYRGSGLNPQGRTTDDVVVFDKQ
jgi:uncharacterized protein (TIGR02246 family)